MKNSPDIAMVASLVGDPARANMLLSLMDGGSLSAGELAVEANLTLSTTSWHLKKLLDAGLISVRKDGRSKFFSLGEAHVAELLEQLMVVSNRLGHTCERPSSKAAQLKRCRVCYDHMAGSRGVWFYQQMHAHGYLNGSENTLRLTREGKRFSEALGIDLKDLGSSERTVCKPCMDWSEGSYHLGGELGAACLNRFIDLNWARRDATQRGLTFSIKGERGLRELFPESH
ncbi:MAG: ArsR family transcriptional regulator [Gammaproteobacteria bacterium]|nr:ArsR family transcriptional regulator [Gammaproteobacteria bacterium]